MKLTCLKPRIATSSASRLTAHKSDTPDAQRGTAHARGYNYKWQVARLSWLRKHPLCVMCEREGHVILADVVDHIVAHRGDPKLFWDSENNWQSLCFHHHNSTKQKEEKGKL